MEFAFRMGVLGDVLPLYSEMFSLWSIFDNTGRELWLGLISRRKGIGKKSMVSESVWQVEVAGR